MVPWSPRRIAQLNCAYMGIFKDMLGYARLNRGGGAGRVSHGVRSGVRMER